MNKNKFHGFFRSIIFSVAFSVIFSFTFLLADGADAASTIGTNMLTTGTLEVQNTASAAYLLTGNTIQVGGHASVAYNRFGTATTTHVGSIAASNDLLISGDFEVNGSAAFDGHAFFGGSASISGELQLNDGRFQPQSDATTAFRFQNAAGDTSVLVIDTTNNRVGIGTTPVTTFEVQGTASAAYFLTGNTIQVGGYSSVAYSRFGTATTTHAGSITTTNDLLISGDLEVNGSAAFDGFARFTDAASVSLGFEVGGNALVNKFVSGATTASASAYVAEFISTATTSILFGDNSSPFLGTCFQLRDTAGTWVFARIIANAWVINTIACR